MRKNILFWIDGESIEKCLTFEEMLEFDDGYCNKVIIKFANKCYKQVKNMQENIMEEQDFYNEGLLRAFYSFKRYRPEKSFVIFLQNGLDKWWLDYTKNIFAKKRKSMSDFISLDESILNEDDNFINELQGSDDKSFDEFMFNEDISNAIKKLDNTEKRIVEFLYNEDDTKKNLAKQLGITRPTLDVKITKVRAKMSILLSDYLVLA